VIKIVTDRKFYKSLLAMAIPVAFQNLISFGVSLTDNLMVSALGDAHLAGASTANNITFLYNILCFGIASGAVVLASQYWGKGNTSAVRKIVAIAMRIAVAASILFMLAGVIAPEACMRIFVPQEDEIVALGAEYLRVAAIAYVFSAVTSVYLICMRSVQQVAVSTVVYGTSFVSNIILNYMFIFGKWGAPELGIVGAAVGTLASRIVEFIIVIVYMHFIEKRVKFNLKYLFRWDNALTKDYLRHGTVVMANELLWALGMTMQSMIIGRMGSDVVAANTVVGNVSQLANIMVFGVANAAGVLVGKAVGAGDREHALKCANTFQIMGVGLGIISAVFVLLARGPIVGLFNLEPETYELTMEMMASMAIILCFVSISAINIMGTLRGGGDVKIGMVMDLTFVWFISVPLGFLGGLVFGWPVPVVYFCLKIDEVIKSIVCFWRIGSKKWIRDLTRPEAAEQANGGI